MPAAHRWFFQQLVLVFDFYHRLGVKHREVCSLWSDQPQFACTLAPHRRLHCLTSSSHTSLIAINVGTTQVRLHNLMLASDSPRSALKISDFEYSKTEQVRAYSLQP